MVSSLSQLGNSSPTNAEREEVGEKLQPSPTEHDFVKFFQSNYFRLVSFLWRMGADHALAVDIAQDAMVETYKHWSKLDSPYPYAQKVGHRLFFKAANRRSSEVPTHTLPDTPQAANEFTAIEEADTVRQILERLPPRQREVIFLRAAGFSPNEIASALGMSAATVRAHLHIARRKIADHGIS